MSSADYEYYVRDDRGQALAVEGTAEEALTSLAAHLESRALCPLQGSYQADVFTRAAASVRTLDPIVLDADSGVRIEAWGESYSFHRDYIEDIDDLGEEQ